MSHIFIPNRKMTFQFCELATLFMAADIVHSETEMEPPHIFRQQRRQPTHNCPTDFLFGSNALKASGGQLTVFVCSFPNHSVMSSCWYRAFGVVVGSTEGSPCMLKCVFVSMCVFVAVCSDAISLLCAICFVQHSCLLPPCRPL